MHQFKFEHILTKEWKSVSFFIFLSIDYFIEQNADFNSPMRNEYFDGSAPRNDYHSSLASSTPLIAAPSSGRGRPKGSSSLKGSKKSSKASTSFSITAPTTIDSDKKSQSFTDNQSAVIDSQMNVLSAVDEQVKSI